MTYKYSPTNAGFYVDGVHPDIPADAVEVADADYGALMTAQCAGKLIVAGPDGMPMATDRPTPPAFRRLSAADFLGRLSPAERAMLSARANADALVMSTMLRWTVSGVDLDGLALKNELNLLVSDSVISGDRLAALIA